MKKLLIICFFLQAPCLLFAQSKDTALTVIDTRLEKLVTTLRVNDHLSVFFTSSFHKVFDLTAVNDGPAVVWHKQITGNMVSAALFKNHVIVIAYSVRKIKHGKAHDFSALMFDPLTGKQTGQKVFYTSDTGKYERAFNFEITENSFRLVVKDEGAERSKYHALDEPTFFSHAAPFYALPRYAITHQLQVFNYNEQLETTSVDNFTVKGSLIGYGFSKKGDMMVAMLNGNDIQLNKFIPGRQAAVNSVNAGLNLPFKLGRRNTPDIMVASSPDAFFYVLENKTKDNVEFRLGKINFADNKYTTVADKLTKDEFTAMEKNYVPVNKDIPKIDFFKTKNIDLAGLLVVGDKMIVSLQPNFYSSYTVDYSQNSTTQMGTVLYNVFSTGLKPLYRSILPASGSVAADRNYGQNNHWDKENNKLYILSTVYQKTDKELFAVLDLNNGRWDKIEIMDKPWNEMSLFDAVWFKNMILMPRTISTAFHSKQRLVLDVKRY